MPVTNPSRQAQPAGKVAPFAGAVVPAGWLLCDGSAVSRVTYAALFAAIGTAWGAGDGATTFNLPDARGEFVRGADNGRGVDAGRALGSAQAQKQPKHQHQWYANTATGSNATIDNTGWSNTGSWDAAGALQGLTGDPMSGAWYTSPDVSNVSEEVRPRNVAMNYIIKT